MIETTHVRIGLIDPNKEVFNAETGDTVSGKEVLKQMKTNNVWRNDHEGKYVGVMYAGQTFKFREGMTLTLPESLARALRVNSAIIVGGDKLNGPIIPFLEIKEKFELQDPSKSTAVTKSPTCCPICGEDQKTFPALTRHMGVEKKKHPELFEEKPTQWDAPTDGEDGADD